VRDDAGPSGKRNCKEQEEIFDQTGDQTKSKYEIKVSEEASEEAIEEASKGGAMPETHRPLQIPGYSKERCAGHNSSLKCKYFLAIIGC
jgi:hypothetical protein